MQWQIGKGVHLGLMQSLSETKSSSRLMFINYSLSFTVPSCGPSACRASTI